jgi:ABC-2 type transport system ATP-binding protein
VRGRGELIAAESLAEFAARGTRPSVTVRTPDAAGLTSALTAAGAAVAHEDDGSCTVTGLDAEHIGDLALHHRVPLHQLTPRTASLEEAFMELTAADVDNGQRHATQERHDDRTDDAQTAADVRARPRHPRPLP